MRSNDSAANVVKLTSEYYKKYNNPAPALLLARQMSELQSILDKAKLKTKKKKK